MKIAVIGSGSWSTALSQVLADNGHDVIVYGISKDEIDDINHNHRNSKYFDCDIHPDIKATLDLAAVNDAEVILLGVPVLAQESVLRQIYSQIERPATFINVAKGFHPITKKRLSEEIKDIMGDKAKHVVSLIGPSHAEEVIERKLTLVNSVCEDEQEAKRIQSLFANDYFRVYTNTDVAGAEIAAALKNIMAIASGALTGLGQGDNAKAALMTRGLAEITRFGIANGGKMETFLGLNGVGDLIVTCSSLHSRNYQAGLAIGKADDASAFLATNKKTTEGINTTRTVYALAKDLNIDMPITNEVYAVLFEGKRPSIAIGNLMRRPLRSENDRSSDD